MDQPNEDESLCVMTIFSSITSRLIAHLESEGGTMNDSTTDALYREANRIPDNVETDLESVERWAVATCTLYRQRVS